MSVIRINLASVVISIWIAAAPLMLLAASIKLAVRDVTGRQLKSPNTIIVSAVFRDAPRQ